MSFIWRLAQLLMGYVMQHFLSVSDVLYFEVKIDERTRKKKIETFAFLATSISSP